MSTATWTSGTPDAGAYAEVNGISLYYETHGAGQPLVLLHGGLGSGEMFGAILPALSERHLDERRPSEGRSRAGDPSRPDSLQHRRLALAGRDGARLPTTSGRSASC